MTVQLLPVLTVIQAFLLFKNFEEENRHVLKILVIRSVWRFRAVNIESGFSGFSTAWVSCLGQSRNPRAVKEEPVSWGFWFQDTLESFLGTDCPYSPYSQSHRQLPALSFRKKSKRLPFILLISHNH
nr:uncharacterized protein LOC119618566 [Chlorocebus sabaeus]